MRIQNVILNLKTGPKIPTNYFIERMPLRSDQSKLCFFRYFLIDDKISTDRIYRLTDKSDADRQFQVHFVVQFSGQMVEIKSSIK